MADIDVLDGAPASTWVKLNGKDGDASLNGVVSEAPVVRPSKSWDARTEKFVDVPVKTKDGKDRDEIVLYVDGDDDEPYAFAFLAGSPVHRDLKDASRQAGVKFSEIQGRHVSITWTGKGPKQTDPHERLVVVGPKG